MTRNVLAVPIRNFKGDIIGVAEAKNKKDGMFIEEDLIILKAFANHAGSLLHNSRVFQSAARARTKGWALAKVAVQLFSEKTLENFMIRGSICAGT